VKAGSGALTFGNPTSAGVPPEVAAQTIVLDYNDVAGLERTFAGIGSEIACIIVEPFAGNMNLVKPNAEFMSAMRRLCDQHGSLLIFDEVMTGFRVDLGGAQKLLGIKPDLTTLGKVIGGGMPVGAFGGRADVMRPWRRSARCIRPGRCRATRSRWPPVWRRWMRFPSPVSMRR